jgi:hypothetical protein
MSTTNAFSENPKHVASDSENANHSSVEVDDREEAVRLSNIERLNARVLLELQVRSAAELHDRAAACAASYAERIAKLPPI